MRELNGELTRCRWRATFCQSFGLVATLNTAAGRELPMRSSRSSTAKKRTSSSPCWLSQSSTARCSSPTLVVIQITADTSRPAAKVTTWPRWMWSVVSSWLVMATRPGGHLRRRPRSVRGEGADRDVAADLAQAADAELLGEPVQVPRQPAGEPVAVALEDGPDVDFLEIGELHRASAEAARRPLEVDLRPAATSVGDRGAAARAFAGGRAV